MRVISDEEKKTIDALTMEELVYEVLRQSGSRFQGEKRDYLLTRHTLLEKMEDDAHKLKELHLAQEANNIAKAANATSSRAYRMSAFSVVVAVVALLATVLQQCSHTP